MHISYNVYINIPDRSSRVFCRVFHWVNDKKTSTTVHRKKDADVVLSFSIVTHDQTVHEI